MPRSLPTGAGICDPLRGQCSQNERRKKLAAPVGMTEKLRRARGLARAQHAAPLQRRGRGWLAQRSRGQRHRCEEYAAQHRGKQFRHGPSKIIRKFQHSAWRTTIYACGVHRGNAASRCVQVSSCVVASKERAERFAHASTDLHRVCSRIRLTRGSGTFIVHPRLNREA